jgi:ketosteroid isomerase-like protein
MTDTRSSLFLPTAGSGAVWDLAREQLSRPRSTDASLDELRQELAIREALARYTYSFDGGDLDAVMTFFTDDSAVTDRHGTTHTGFDEVRANYQRLIETTHRRFHLWTNVVVRLSDGLREAWRIAYFHAYLEPIGGPPQALGGAVADHMVKRDGEWRMRERSVSVDLDYALDAIQ